LRSNTPSSTLSSNSGASSLVPHSFTESTIPSLFGNHSDYSYLVSREMPANAPPRDFIQHNNRYFIDSLGTTKIVSRMESGLSQTTHPRIGFTLLLGISEIFICGG
jgi:hypothetical protein